MHILFATPEALPYSKTGGLGDVACVLPDAVAELGHTVHVMTPYYRSARKVDPKPEQVAQGSVPVGTEMVTWKLLRSRAVDGKAERFLIANDQYFDRDGIYGNRQGDYQDACCRYVFFCRSVLAAAEALDVPVDVYHCNDWHSAMIPVYLKLSFSSHPFHSKASTLFTIHNMAFQGLFWHWDWPYLNLPWKHFNWKELEFHGKVNLLKGALIHADLLNTVSPTYAREIQTREFGSGLHGVLSERAEDLYGVVNGIDTAHWDPTRDKLLPANYSEDDLSGKEACKRALLERLDLPTDESGPVIGMIGRLYEQKGFDLIAQAFESLARRDLRLVILGTGDERYHRLLRRMKELYPNRLGVSFAFDNTLAHLIEAGSDMFLMPSRFEPCGLSQLYALRYGTVPVVHKTGGLADTVVNASPRNLTEGHATGFVFEEFTSSALLAVLDRALSLFNDEPETWRAMQLRGMKQDWSWNNSARDYVRLYERAKTVASRRPKS